MSDVLRCPTVTLMDRSEAHVGHAAVSDSDSQRTRALGGARKNVSKTGTERIMHAYEKCLAPISDRFLKQNNSGSNPTSFKS